MTTPLLETPFVGDTSGKSPEASLLFSINEAALEGGLAETPCGLKQGCSMPRDSTDELLDEVFRDTRLKHGLGFFRKGERHKLQFRRELSGARLIRPQTLSPRRLTSQAVRRPRCTSGRRSASRIIAPSFLCCQGSRFLKAKSSGICLAPPTQTDAAARLPR